MIWKMYFGMAVGLVLSCCCMAGFNYPGYELQVIKSEQGLDNAAVSFQTNPLWIGATPDKPYNFSTSFTLPEADEIVFARLFLNIWGGNNDYTCRVNTMINGTEIDVIH